MAANEKNEILNPRQNNKTNRQKREEEEKQIKMLKIFGAVALGIVVLAVIIGIILGIVNKPSRKTVAKVGNETIKLDEFQKAVSLQRSNINNNYAYMQQLYSMFGMDVDASTREQYAMQMSDAYKGILGQQVLSNMIDQRVMAYGAEKEGITVSDEEVEAQYQSLFGYYPNGTPTAAPTAEPFEATPTVSEEQLAILRYTDTPMPTEVSVAEDGETVTEEPAESAEEIISEAEETLEETVNDTVTEVSESVEEAIEEVKEAAAEAETVVEETVAEASETVEEAVEAVEEAVAEASETVEEVVEAVEETAAEASETVEEAVEAVEEVAEEAVEETAEPTPGPTPTVYTEDMFNAYETYYFANNFYYDKEFLKKELKYELLKDKVEGQIETTVPRSADMVWARHILVETEEEALAALERINNGEEWGDVAAEVSTDSTASNGGDLGWFTEGTMVQEFNDAAFAQEVGTISDPVQTDFGYHLIQVIAHEEHPYTSSQYSDAVEVAYQKWLDSYAEQLDISFESDVTSMTPTDPAFVG